MVEALAVRKIDDPTGDERQSSREARCLEEKTGLDAGSPGRASRIVGEHHRGHGKRKDADHHRQGLGSGELLRRYGRDADNLKTEDKRCLIRLACIQLPWLALYLLFSWFIIMGS